MSRSVISATACALACLVACSDDGGGGPGIDAATDARPDAPTDAALDAPTGPFTLTSPVLVEGAAFGVDYTCNGANKSPPLAWVNTPPGTRSLAVILTDTNVNLIHWAIYDIPAPRVGLPEEVDRSYRPADVPGARQAKSYNAEVTGYLGPCPPQQHNYRFTLYAVEVDELPGTSEATTRVQLQALLNDHDVATATLSGTYAQPPP